MTKKTINERVAAVKGFQPYRQQRTGHIVPLMWFDGVYDSNSAFQKDWQHSIADAWELVEEMTYQVRAVRPPKPARGGYLVEMLNGRDQIADTAPEAICLAWLSIHEGNADD